MGKGKYSKDMNDIQNMFTKIHTMNEAIQFNDDEWAEGMDKNYEEQQQGGAEGEAQAQPQAQAEEPNATPEMANAQEPDEEKGLRELGEIDTIREIALKGMIKLCKTPEDDRYQALKKIFQFCDKAADSAKDENKQ